MQITQLQNYSDENGNCIKYDGEKIDCDIVFRDKTAHNNILSIHKDAKIRKLKIEFLCNNAIIRIGKCSDGKFSIQAGEDCIITIGDKVTCTSSVYIFTAEGTIISIGNDVMFASGVYIKSHDHHPIFNIKSGKRINKSKNIIIEDHVWLADQVYVGKSSIIKSGSMIGFRSFVSGYIPNNCLAVGTPAKVIKKDIAWERPLLNWVEPFYKPDATCLKKSDYWNLTEE